MKKENVSEQAFKRKVLRYLKQTYPDAFVYKVTDTFYSGLPDVFFLLKGTVFFFELKFGRNKATKIQLAVIAKLERAGAICGVCYTLEDVKKILGKGGINNE